MKTPIAERPHRKKPSNRLDIPWLKQTDDYSCGAVAGWIALKALYPKKRNKRVFYKDCNPSEQYGTSTVKLAKALRKHNVRVSIRKTRISFKTIKDCVDFGIPIIACIKTNYSWFHWVVIYAYAEEKDRLVYLANNGWTDHNGEISYTEFNKLASREYLLCSCK